VPRKTSKILTESEIRIMEILWNEGKCTVTRVVECLAPDVPLAYTTVLTTLRILEDKGHVAHSKSGRAHVYYPLTRRDQARQSVLTTMLERFFDDSPEELLVNLLKEKDLTPEEIQNLRKVLDRKERET